MMYERVKRSIKHALIGALILGPFSDNAFAQEGEAGGPDIHNVLLTFHLVQADGFADQDPEISDVVSELRKLFNFQGYRLLSNSVFNIGMLRSTGGTYVSGNGSQRIFAGDSEMPLTIRADVSSRRSAPGTVRARVTLTEATSRLRGGEEAMVIISETLPLLEASVTIRDGQRVVLGSARRTVDEPVLILVVTPRIDP